MNARPVTDRIVIADQPTEGDLRGLPAEGFAAVVNLRTDGEPEQPLDPAAEGVLVRALGLDYRHIPIGSPALAPDDVAAVAGLIEAHPNGKVLVHCRKGGRAAALVLLQQAQAHGWPAAEAVARGEALGLKLEGNLRPKVEQYLAENA